MHTVNGLLIILQRKLGNRHIISRIIILKMRHIERSDSLGNIRHIKMSIILQTILLSQKLIFLTNFLLKSPHAFELAHQILQISISLIHFPQTNHTLQQMAREKYMQILQRHILHLRMLLVQIMLIHLKVLFSLHP